MKPIFVRAGIQGMEIQIYPSHPLYAELLLQLEREMHPEVGDECEQLAPRNEDKEEK